MWSKLRFIGGGLDICECFTDGTVTYRAIPKKAWTNSFIKSDQYRNLVEKGLIIDLKRTDINPETFPKLKQAGARDRIIYESEFIPFALYSATPGAFWTRAHMIEFATSYARINKNLTDCQCDEPVEGNFAFIGSTPMLLDIGAVAKDHNLGAAKQNLTREMNGFGFGCRIAGIDFHEPNAWDKLLTVVGELIDKEAVNQWDDYNKRPLPIPGHAHDDDVEMTWMRSLIGNKDIKTVLDVGGNDGYFSFAIERDDLRVCCIDNAKNAIIKGFRHAKKHNSKVVFYEVDVTKDYEPHTRRLTKEVVHWQEKLEADCVVVSSVMHHLLHQDKNLKWQDDLYQRLARKYLLIEYIDKQDPHVKDWPQQWSHEQFQKLMIQNWEQISTLENYARSPDSRPHRKWYAFKRREPKPFSLGVSIEDL